MVVNRIKYYTKLYFMILGMQVRSRMSFRANFWVMLFSTFFRELATLALMFVVVTRFEGLSGWTTWEMAFLYSVVTFTYRNCSSFVGGVREIPALIKTGEMDAYLLTPANTLFLINARNTVIWRAFYNIPILVLTVFCGIQAGILFAPGNIMMFLLMMISAMMLLFGMYMIIFSLAYFVVEVRSFVQIIDEIIKKYMIYPINIYGLAAAFLFTFLLPIGFVAYYPSAYLLGKMGGLLFSPYLGILTPVFALLWVAVGIVFWHFARTRYQSTGT